jgi:hypothetical protein
VLGRGRRTKQTGRFTESIAFEQEMDGDGNAKKTRKRQQKPSTQKSSGNRFNPLQVHNDSDADDDDFEGDATSSNSSSDSDDSEIQEITNEEVRDLRFNSPTHLTR